MTIPAVATPMYLMILFTLGFGNNRNDPYTV